jgi:hypothetical protein
MHRTTDQKGDLPSTTDSRSSTNAGPRLRDQIATSLAVRNERESHWRANWSSSSFVRPSCTRSIHEPTTDRLDCHSTRDTARRRFAGAAAIFKDLLVRQTYLVRKDHRSVSLQSHSHPRIPALRSPRELFFYCPTSFLMAARGHQPIPPQTTQARGSKSWIHLVQLYCDKFIFCRLPR